MPYIEASVFFELPATALASVVAVRYGKAGVLAVILGSLCLHLLYMTINVALCLALIAGLAAFMFTYCFKLLHSQVIVINQVSSVATFAFVVTPIVCAVHSVCSVLILQYYQLMPWDGFVLTSWGWWFDELLLAYLTVPLLLSSLSYEKVYFSVH